MQQTSHSIRAGVRIEKPLCDAIGFAPLFPLQKVVCSQKSLLHEFQEVALIRVPASLVTIGKRFRHDIFDENGQLLLMRGMPVASELQVVLIKRQGFRKPAKSRAVSSFGAIYWISDRLTVIEEDILEKRDGGVWKKRIANLVKDFVDVVDAEPDAAFANLHLENRHSYFVVHSMVAAVVCSRLALARGYDEQERARLIAAALTHDFGMIELQPQISGNDDLTPTQKARIRQHGNESVRMLREFGIDDPVWLAAIEDHHEYLDGSGYAGKHEADIAEPARILAIADAISAMLRPRPYRERIFASQALERLFVDDFMRYDRSILESLFWDLGFFPPGSLVRLASRELGVAIRNTPGLLDSPIVAVLTDPDGRPLLAPVLRDSQDAGYAIVEALDPSLANRVGRVIEECWATPGAAAVRQTKIA